jgi:hypothetical protein
MSEDQYDLAIAAGLAGNGGALRADPGSRGVLCEAGPAAKYSRCIGGVLRIGFKDVRTEPRELRRATNEATGGFLNAGLASSLAGTPARSLFGWLNREGCQGPRTAPGHAYRQGSQ